MANTFNKIIAIGRLGREPEQRFTASGSAVTTFSIATDHSFKDKSGELKSETEWLAVTTWNKSAELCNQYLNKGSLVYIEGRLKTRTWEKQDGTKGSRTEVIAERVLFLDPKKTNGTIPNPVGDSSSGDIEPDDIPF